MNDAKFRLLLKHPFFAFLILQMETSSSEELKRAKISGKKIMYPPEYEQLPIESQVYVLMSAALKVGLCHHTRRRHRDNERWQTASELTVASILSQNGVSHPDCRVTLSPFDGKLVEEVYDLLPQTMPKIQCMSEIRDHEGDKDSEEERVKAKLASAAQAAKKAGKLPGGLEELINEFLNPKLPWNQYLDQYLTEKMKDDYNWSKRNRRYPGVYLPGMESLKMGKISVFGDSSGSIFGTKEFLEVVSEAKGISDMYKIPIELIYVDTEVRGVDLIEPGQALVINPKGGGGTDFRPPFEYVKEDPPLVAIYLTDGECNSFPEPPEFDTLWLVDGREGFDPPFGHVIYYHK